eukprot:gene2907-3092_t
MDLNIRTKASSDARERTNLLKRVLELGWEGIAWNQIVLAKASQRNQARPKEPIVLTTVEAQEIMKSRSLITANSTYAPINQYNRITLLVDDIADAQNITANNDHLRTFDIVAVQPGNAKVLAHICKSCDVDIICFDFTKRISFQVSKKLIDAAIERGIQFEITYGPVYYSQVSRREIFNNSKYLITMLRRRNLILSSGTDDAVNLRGRYEGMNVGILMQFSPEEARAATKDNCIKVIQHGIQRKNRFLPVEIYSLQEFQESKNSRQVEADRKDFFKDAFEARETTKHQNKRKRSLSMDSEGENDDA